MSEAGRLLDELQDILRSAKYLKAEERQDLAEILRGWADSQAVAPAEPQGGFPQKFGMVGKSPAMEKIFALLGKIVHTDVSVLIAGETGTGKELVAEALHQHGGRRKGPFVAVNCAAIPATLLEAEIFGHKKGAFTGAHQDRVGYAASAAGGTLFLDEIGEMPMELQVKLLRFVQEGEVRPVGSNQVEKVDVRVVAATNKHLPEQIKGGLFREDLYYRLAVLTVELPPLRDRATDVLLLADFILHKKGVEGVPTAVLSSSAKKELLAYAWPGNIRELQNVLARAAAFAEKSEIKSSDLSLSAN